MNTNWPFAALGVPIVNLFGFEKVEPKRRRKMGKSRKWLNYVKKEAESKPDLSRMVDNPILKAAVLSRDNDFEFKLSDFKRGDTRDMAFIQHMISVVETLKIHNPPQLEDMKRKAMQDGAKVVKTHSPRRGARVVNGEINEGSLESEELIPPPYSNPPYFKPCLPPSGDLVQLLKIMKEAIESVN